MNRICRTYAQNIRYPIELQTSHQIETFIESDVNLFACRVRDLMILADM